MQSTKLIGILAASCALALPASAAEVSFMYPDWVEPLVGPAMEKYEADTGNTVNAIRMPTDAYDQRVAVDLAAGTAPDVVVIDSYMIPQLAEANYLMPLDDALSSWDQYQYYIDGILSVGAFEGAQYALPTDTDVRMLWYYKPNFEAAGIEMPWEPKNWQDILDAATKVKEATDIDYAFILPAGTKQGEAATMQGFYMALLGADVPTDGRNSLRDWDAGQWIGASPALERTVNLYDEVYNQLELTDPSINYATDVGNAVRQALADGEIGIDASGSWEWACLFDCNGVNLPSPEERNELIGWAPWPGSGVEGAPETTNISGGWAIGVNANAADADDAIAFLKTIFDREGFERWVVDYGRMAVRSDIAESEAYQQDAFLAEATKLLESTRARDTYPGYQVVSSLVQDMTGAIIDGVSPEDALEEYHEALIDEFGEENVKTFE